MASYVIGDVQGCFAELSALLTKIDFAPGRDRLYLVGDLVNRGPGSLQVLRWAYEQREHIQVVLGNHDLHLLAVSAGLAKQKRGDTLESILTAHDADQLLAWLRAQPLVQAVGRYLMVHAGLMPGWSAQQALALSAEVSAVLNSEQGTHFLAAMYGNQPDYWDDGLQGMDRLRVVVNTCTRMRMLNANGRLELGFKGELADAPASLRAWFDLPCTVRAGHTVLCGHWSALGLLIREDVIALDTGCIWGGSLSALRLDDGQLFQVPAAPRPPAQY